MHTFLAVLAAIFVAYCVIAVLTEPSYSTPIARRSPVTRADWGITWLIFMLGMGALIALRTCAT